VLAAAFSKICLRLAGLRIGYGVGPAEVITAMRKVQRAFDVTTPGPGGGLASLDGHAEVARRRAVNRQAMASLEAVLRNTASTRSRPRSATSSTSTSARTPRR
jgi:histidinol-phosphate aminotransferase